MATEPDYERYRFSITVKTADRAVLACLRALCQDAETAAKKQIGWGGTGISAWVKNGNQVTLRFTSSENRKDFTANALRLLLPHFEIVEKSDNNPATRQRS
ncbi:MAG: hypothetical protein IBJ19_12435 [Gemmatimonadaceae bacterium]|nr:hypothetical protein [Gemmatimonadaceae bacterium]